MREARLMKQVLTRVPADAQAPQGSTVYADSGSNITSTVAAIGSSTIACDYCYFQGPGATTFTNLTSASVSAPASTPSPSQSAPSPGGGSSSISGGAIAGIVIGALAGVALVALLAWLLLMRRNQAAKDVEMAKTKAEKPQVTSVKNRTPPGAIAPLHPYCCLCARCSAQQTLMSSWTTASAIIVGGRTSPSPGRVPREAISGPPPSRSSERPMLCACHHSTRTHDILNDSHIDLWSTSPNGSPAWPRSQVCVLGGGHGQLLEPAARHQRPPL